MQRAPNRWRFFVTHRLFELFSCVRNILPVSRGCTAWHCQTAAVGSGCAFAYLFSGFLGRGRQHLAQAKTVWRWGRCRMTFIIPVVLKCGVKQSCGMRAICAKNAQDTAEGYRRQRHTISSTWTSTRNWHWTRVTGKHCARLATTRNTLRRGRGSKDTGYRPTGFSWLDRVAPENGTPYRFQPL